MKSKGFKIYGKVRAILRDAKTNKIKLQTGWIKNKFVQVGREAIIRRLGNEGLYSNEGQVTYVAVGTGTSIPADSDTTLETELERKLLGDFDRTTVTGTFQAYFTKAEANGTISELGLFGEEATASADTGTLFERALFTTPFTKTNSDTLTVEISLACEEA